MPGPLPKQVFQSAYEYAVDHEGMDDDEACEYANDAVLEWADYCVKQAKEDRD